MFSEHCGHGIIRQCLIVLDEEHNIMYFEVHDWYPKYKLMYEVLEYCFSVQGILLSR
jgi:hypothetical protein